MAEIMALLEDADDLTGDLEPFIDEGRLAALFPRMTLSAEEVRSGLTWLVGNHGHAREHVGQVQLTRHVFLVRSARRLPPNHPASGLSTFSYSASARSSPSHRYCWSRTHW